MKTALGYILALIIALLWACGLQCNEQKQPETERIEQSRKQDIKKSDSLGVRVDSFIVERWHEAKKGKARIDSVYVMDSAAVNLYYDSLVKSELNALIQFYELKSCSVQLSLMDSAHVLDSLRIGVLMTSNLKADTIILKLQKDVRRERNAKRLWQGIAVVFVAIAAAK